MSKIAKAAATSVEAKTLQTDKVVTNFMGGDSYTINPLDTLKMVSASSIFGEPSYYRDGGLAINTRAYAAREYGTSDLLDGFRVITGIDGRNTSEVMVEAIDAALDYDFEGTLKWAAELRNNYFIRLNPQIILVRAAKHPNRAKFTEKNPAKFAQYAYKIMRRADDAMSGIAYYLYDNGSKANMPSVLKRAYCNKLSSLGRYEVNKYKNHEIGMINAVRITHANSPVINELMKNGSVEISESETTWETMRSEGKSWAEIFNTIEMGHMALLRNIRGFFTEVVDTDLRKQYLEKLKGGVLKGKQFPFRYYNAYNAVDDCKDIPNKRMVLDALEECIDIAVENMPKLNGRVAILTDNSGSAWGDVVTEYGKVHVAEINNLSAVLTAARADEGVVYKFGDTLRKFEISKRNGLLAQAKAISADEDDDVGGATEGGIWEFFDSAIANREHWDSIFIYSDQQAGLGGLYGTDNHKYAYRKRGYSCGSGDEMINVFKLTLEYRKHVNKRVNVFSVQTAGYDNNVLPEYTYRTNLMYGWTGRETVFADAVIKQWDAIESRK